MRNSNFIAGSCTALVMALASTAPVGAQSLAQRISQVSDGTVRVSFNVRKGICGSGNSIRRGNGNMTWSSDRSEDVEWDDSCYSGPGRLVALRRSGETIGLRFYVGGRWRPSSSATDVGMISAPQVAAYLVSLAES